MVQNVLGTFIQEVQQLHDALQEMQAGLLTGAVQPNQAISSIQPLITSLGAKANESGLKASQSLFEALTTFLMGANTLHSTFLFPALLLQLKATLASMLSSIPSAKHDDGLGIEDLAATFRTLDSLGDSLAFRYKITVEFEESYEVKYLRAFMVLKELRPHVQFISLTPDLTKNQNANLNNGLQMEVISKTDPRTLHSIAGSVLEVTAVKILIETRKAPAVYLINGLPDPTLDQRVTEFVT